jgi:hypothetical protein
MSKRQREYKSKNSLEDSSSESEKKEKRTKKKRTQNFLK